MINKIFINALFLSLINGIFSADLRAEEKQVTKAVGIEENIKHLNWNGIEVVYIEDNRFPTFDLTLYFADGALSDGRGESGLAAHSFSLLDSGTDKLSQKDILDQLEFLGVGVGNDVTHEYSTVTVSGLTKDLQSSMTQICSLMRSATYPENIVAKELELERSSLQNMVSSPKALAERTFREIVLGETPYSYPASGKLVDFKSYTTDKLRKKMDYFLNDVKKRVYLTGPKSVLKLEEILVKECRFKGENKDLVRSVFEPNIRINKPQFIFVPVPDANQVQLRVGRFINRDETNERNLDALSSEFLGGGFTSRLMREVRVKRGLTYSIGAFVSSQKEYGRAGISTFTKNETINKLIEVVGDTIGKIETDGITEEELAHSMNGMVGSYPFKFESNPAFLGQLMLLDHIGKPYSDLFSFKESVQKYKSKDVVRRISEVFGMKSQVILVLGDKSLEKELKKLAGKYGKLKVIDYKKFL